MNLIYREEYTILTRVRRLWWLTSVINIIIELPLWFLISESDRNGRSMQVPDGYLPLILIFNYSKFMIDRFYNQDLKIIGDTVYGYNYYK